MAEYLYCSCTGAIHNEWCSERRLTDPDYDAPARPSLPAASTDRHVRNVVPYCKACGRADDHYCTGTPGTTSGQVLDLSEVWKRLNEDLHKAAAPQCKTHPRYQAKRKPRLPCEACWRKYIYLHPGTP